MKGRALEVKVGILVTLCGGILAAFIILLGDFSRTEGHTVYMDVVTSANLKSGANVKIAGVLAGKVVDVSYRGGTLDETTGKPVFVRVTLHVDKAKFATLKKDAALYITSVGVLGEKYVEVHPGSPGGTPLEPGTILQGRPPMQLELITADVTAVLQTLNDLLVKNRQDLDTIITSTSTTVKAFERAAETMERLVSRNEPKLEKALNDFIAIEADAKRLLSTANHALGDGDEVKATIANLRGLTHDLRTNTRPILKDVRGALRKFGQAGDTAQEVMNDVKATVAGTTGKMNKTFEQVSLVVEDVHTLTKNLRQGRGTIGALLSDTEMYEDVKELVKDLKRHPWKFLWKQ